MKNCKEFLKWISGAPEGAELAGYHHGVKIYQARKNHKVDEEKDSSELKKKRRREFFRKIK